MGNLSFEIEGDKVLSRNFANLADDVTELKKEFVLVGNTIISGAKKNFEREGSAISKWKKLAPATIKARTKRQGYYKKSPSGSLNSPLFWTGNTKSSFRATTGNLFAVVDNTAPFFKFHQQKSRSGNLPRRVMLDMSATTKLAITNIIAKGLNSKLTEFKRSK